MSDGIAMNVGMVFCRGCGATIHGTAPVCPKCGAPQSVVAVKNGSGDEIERTFINSISICFQKYATFSGRASRAEFWYFVLFTTITSFVLAGISELMDMGSILSSIFSLAIILPSLSVTVRRLHDTERSGWWYWIILIPIIGIILIIVWMCSRGRSGANRYGSENGLNP
jgi:uncharacterized membrane protein YhaH (DUF805 family)